MGLGATGAATLGRAAKAIEERLAKAGITRPIAGSANDVLLRNALPSAALTTGMNLIGGVDPMTSAIAGALDLGLNVGGTKLAGKYFPGTLGQLSVKGEAAPRSEYIPSFAQGAAQAVAPMAASLAITPLIQNQQQQEMDQTVSLQQQAMQRQLINGNLVQALSPGTQFQMQGLEQTISPVTLGPNLLDTYGYARGMI
jgi:hypothetical protein